MTANVSALPRRCSSPIRVSGRLQTTQRALQWVRYQPVVALSDRSLKILGLGEAEDETRVHIGALSALGAPLVSDLYTFDLS